jgi:uncharacterized cupredoxin-like copper-binding protein
VQRFHQGFLATGALLVGLLAPTACGGTSASGAPTDVIHATGATQTPNGSQAITITVGDSMSFDPAAIVVRAGQPVELTLRNTGQGAHDFSLSQGVAQPVKLTSNGGDTANTTFTIDKPGTYTFDCSMFGHALAGMRGTITAQ